VDYLYEMVPERAKELEMAAQAAKPIEWWTANRRGAVAKRQRTHLPKSMVSASMLRQPTQQEFITP
jgi:hypothetical protein